MLPLFVLLCHIMYKTAVIAAASFLYSVPIVIGSPFSSYSPPRRDIGLLSSHPFSGMTLIEGFRRERT